MPADLHWRHLAPSLLHYLVDVFESFDETFSQPITLLSGPLLFDVEVDDDAHNERDYHYRDHGACLVTFFRRLFFTVWVSRSYYLIH